MFYSHCFKLYAALLYFNSFTAFQNLSAVTPPKFNFFVLPSSGEVLASACDFQGLNDIKPLWRSSTIVLHDSLFIAYHSSVQTRRVYVAWEQRIIYFRSHFQVFLSELTKNPFIQLYQGYASGWKQSNSV